MAKYDYDNTNLNASNIKFLSGTLSALNDYLPSSTNSLKKGLAVEGAFYLTTDTHRLYLGRTVKVPKANITYNANDSSTYEVLTIPVPVNEGIETVSSINNLPSTANPGEFYYISDSNILAVYSGSGSNGTNGWVLLNSDTNDTIEVTATSLSKDDVQNENDKIKYTLKISQTKKDKLNNTTSLTDITTSFSILKSDIQAAIGVGISSAAVSNNSTEIKLSGNGADTTKKVTVTGAGSVTLSGSANNITITGTDTDTKYTLNSDANSTVVTLQDSENNTSGTSGGTVTFGVKANTENLAVDGTTAGEVNYYHTTAGNSIKKTGTDNIDYKGDNTAGTLSINDSNSSSFKVPKIARDANGHITTIEDITLTLPDSKSFSIKNINADNTGKITITKNDNTTVDSFTNNPSGKSGVLFNTLTVDGTTSTVYNQGNLGTFYSADKIDEKIATAVKGVNAMTYKGTVGSSGSTQLGSTLPTSGVSIGDTYLADQNGNLTGYIYGNNEEGKKGDLYIATSSDGTEDANGHIASNKINWTRVEAGDIDTKYTLKSTGGNNASINITDSGNNTDGVVQFIGGDHVTVTGTATNNKSGSITIDHSAPVVEGATSVTPGTGTTLSLGGTFSIPKFSYDAKGHIASSGTETFTLPTVDSYTLNQYDNSTGTGDKKALIRLWKGTTSAGKITIEGDGEGTSGENKIISTATTTNGIKISHAESTVSTTGTSSTATDIPAAGIDVVTEVGYDAYGHINKYVTKKYKVPTAVTYGLDDAIDTAYSTDTTVSTIQWRIKDSAGTTSGLGETISLGSDTLRLLRTGTSAYKVDMVWETF